MLVCNRLIIVASVSMVPVPLVTVYLGYRLATDAILVQDPLLTLCLGYRLATDASLVKTFCSQCVWDRLTVDALCQWL